MSEHNLFIKGFEYRHQKLNTAFRQLILFTFISFVISYLLFSHLKLINEKRVETSKQIKQLNKTNNIIKDKTNEYHEKLKKLDQKNHETKRSEYESIVLEKEKTIFSNNEEIKILNEEMTNAVDQKPITKISMLGIDAPIEHVFPYIHLIILICLIIYVFNFCDILLYSGKMPFAARQKISKMYHTEAIFEKGNFIPLIKFLIILLILCVQFYNFIAIKSLTSSAKINLDDRTIDVSPIIDISLISKISVYSSLFLTIIIFISFITFAITKNSALNPPIPTKNPNVDKTQMPQP